jgi:predicted nucleic acid-binding protein
VIVIDTNVLHGRSDPAAASPLAALLDLATQVRVGVAIPEACIVELVEGMREKLVEADEVLRSAVSKVRRLQVRL